MLKKDLSKFSTRLLVNQDSSNYSDKYWESQNIYSLDLNVVKQLKQQ